MKSYLSSLLLLISLLGCSDNNNVTNEQKIGTIYQQLSLNHDGISFLSVEETIENSYLVKLLVSSSSQVELSSSKNTKQENISITERWSKLVCTPKINTFIQRENIMFFSVKQTDSKGISHSIAIC
jgi:hypothetical protein